MQNEPAMLREFQGAIDAAKLAGRKMGGDLPRTSVL